MFRQRASVGLFSACMLVLLSCVLLLAACGTTQYKLSLTASDGGTVTGAGTYDEGTVVTIKANPNANYHFVGWYLNADHSGEPLSTNTSYTVTVDAEKAYYALFAENEKVTVTLTAVGDGTVVGTGDYYTGETITITATPNTDSHFFGWYTNPECTGTPLSTSASLEITVQDNITYYALFRSNTVMVNAPVTTGGSVTGAGEYDTGAQVTLTATASDLYAFLGWYSTADFAENSLLSSDATYTFTANDTTTIYPRFETSAINFLNRIIDGAYYKYSSWTENDDLSAYNMTGSVDFALAAGNINIDVTLNAAMALDLDGTDSRFMLELLNNADDSTLLGIYYIDGVDNAKLYFDLNGTKYTYNFLSLAQYIGELSVSQPSSTPWTLQSIISSLTGDESISNILSMFLGYDANGLWFGGFNVEGNEIAFDIYVQRLLQDLSPFLGAIVDQNISAIITNIANTMPALNINIAANFSDQGGHKVLEGASLNIVTDGEFPINVDEISITLPEFNATLGINNLDAGFASELANVAIDTERFPATAINLLNLSVGADLNFYSGETSETLAHAYRLELNTDINPFAILPAITTDESGTVAFDVNAIEWEKLGFLSLRIYDPTGTANDYLNIYYDSNESTQIYVFAPLLKDITFTFLAPYTLNINNSYEISEFIPMIQTVVASIDNLTGLVGGLSTMSASPMLLADEATEPTEPTTPSESTDTGISSDTISTVISAVLSLAMGGDFNQVFVDTVLALTPDNTLVTTNLTYDATKGMVLKIDDRFKQDVNLKIEALYGMVSINLHDVIFGADTTAIALKFDAIEYGKNLRNEAGQVVNHLVEGDETTYLDQFEAASLKKYNTDDTKLITEINSIGIDSIDYRDDYSGSTTANVTLIDGTTADIDVMVTESEVLGTKVENGKVVADVIFTLYTKRASENGYNNGLSILSLRANIFKYQTTVTLTGFAGEREFSTVANEELLQFYNQQQIDDFKKELSQSSTKWSFLTVDLIDVIPSDAEIMCTVTDENKTIVTTTGIVYNADRTAAATIIKWSKNYQFDKTYTAEFYYMSGEQKVVIDMAPFTPSKFVYGTDDPLNISNTNDLSDEEMEVYFDEETIAEVNGVTDYYKTMVTFKIDGNVPEGAEIYFTVTDALGEIVKDNLEIAYNSDKTYAATLITWVADDFNADPDLMQGYYITFNYKIGDNAVEVKSFYFSLIGNQYIVSATEEATE